MNLSVCIIAKNEEKNMERCLKALMPYGFETIVVDTGSTDRTKEIAFRYATAVHDFTWCDDFSAAKNYAVSKATNDYVMIVDADEFLEPLEQSQLEVLYQMIEEQPEKVGRIYRKNIFVRAGELNENDEWLNRIFAKDKFCYEGSIHEQVVAKDGGTYEMYRTGLSFLHTGYDLPEEQRKEKAERNIRLLEKELDHLKKQQELRGTQTEEEFVSKISYVLYQLGKSYYMEKDYEKACIYFSQGLSYDLEPKLEYVIDMVETYGYALLNSGRASEAMLFENIYEEFGKTADFQFLMGLIYMNNERFEEAVQEFLKATAHTECRSKGVNSYLAFYNIGVIYECLGEIKPARRAYEKCKDYAPAQERLRIIK